MASMLVTERNYVGDKFEHLGHQHQEWYYMYEWNYSSNLIETELDKSSSNSLRMRRWVLRILEHILFIGFIQIEPKMTVQSGLLQSEPSLPSLAVSYKRLIFK